MATQVACGPLGLEGVHRACFGQGPRLTSADFLEIHHVSWTIYMGHGSFIENLPIINHSNTINGFYSGFYNHQPFSIGWLMIILINTMLETLIKTTIFYIFQVTKLEVRTIYKAYGRGYKFKYGFTMYSTTINHQPLIVNHKNIDIILESTVNIDWYQYIYIYINHWSSTIDQTICMRSTMFDGTFICRFPELRVPPKSSIYIYIYIYIYI